jgi:hypothetical protein
MSTFQVHAYQHSQMQAIQQGQVLKVPKCERREQGDGRKAETKTNLRKGGWKSLRFQFNKAEIGR